MTHTGAAITHRIGPAELQRFNAFVFLFLFIVTLVFSFATPTYDGNGNLTFDGTTTILVTDADNNALLDYAGSGGAVQQWYAWGQDTNTLLNQVNAAAGTRETAIPDFQGSIVGSLASNTGTLTKAGFQTYGVSTSTANNNFGYTGSRIATSGLVDMRARFYSPTIGRFLSVDPIGTSGGVNLYAYVNNDPLNLTDPSGNCPACVGAIGGAAVGLAAQGWSDLVRHEDFKWQNYAGAAAGGAAGGALMFTSFNPVAAGAAAGAAQNLVRQGANYISGSQTNFDVVSLGVETGMGAALGWASNAAASRNFFPGLNNEFTALSRQMITKLENGTISNMQTSTAAKTFIGAAEGWAPSTLASPFTDSFSDWTSSSIRGSGSMNSSGSSHLGK